MENFDEKQSLQLISQMINTAKKRIENNSFFFLLWGWAVLIASVLHYYLMVHEYSLHFLPWPVLMTGTAIVSVIYGYRMDKSSKAKSYFDSFLSTLWICTAGALLLTLLVLPQLTTFRVTYLVLLLLYGLGTLISGTVINFKPLIAGGLFIWGCAVLLVWVDFPNTLLVMGASVFGGYIIPGYILRAKRERNPNYGL